MDQGLTRGPLTGVIAPLIILRPRCDYLKLQESSLSRHQRKRLGLEFFKGHSYQFTEGTGLVRVTLPSILVTRSVWGGKGLFARQYTPADTFITEYARELISHDDSTKMLLEGQDTRLLSIWTNFLVLDGSVHG